MDDPIVEQIQQLITYQLVDDQSDHQNIMVKLDETDTTITYKHLYRPEEIRCIHFIGN